MKQKLLQIMITVITVAALLALAACGGTAAPNTVVSIGTPESGATPAAPGESATSGAQETDLPENTELTPSIVPAEGFELVDKSSVMLRYEGESHNISGRLFFEIRWSQESNPPSGDSFLAYHVEDHVQTLSDLYEDREYSDITYTTINGMDAAEFTFTWYGDTWGYTCFSKGTTLYKLIYYGESSNPAVYDENEAIFRSMVDSFVLE